MLVCITGKVGSGKSTALKIIKSQGYHVLSMDDYIHRLYFNGKIGYKLIKKHFGTDFVNSEKVDRKKLGKLVFSDKKSLEKLNRLMIPIMQAKLEKIAEKSTLYFVEMGIYLYQESAFSKYFSKVILIEAKKTLQIKNFNKKMPYIRKFPTTSVGKLDTYHEMGNKLPYILVENHKNLKKFQGNILKILKSF
jgi:dephospho-CoA kinase